MSSSSFYPSELRTKKTDQEENVVDRNDADENIADAGDDVVAQPKTLHDVHQVAFEKLKQLRQKYGKEEDDGGDFDLDDLEDLDLSDDDIDDDFDDEEEEDDD